MNINPYLLLSVNALITGIMVAIGQYISNQYLIRLIERRLEKYGRKPK